MLNFKIRKIELKEHLAGIILSHECLNNTIVNYGINKLNYIFAVESLNQHC